MVLILPAVLVACDDSFTPIIPSQQFTVYGYIDPSAETQWIRVAPVRQQLFNARDTSFVVVTLERESPSQVIALTDSLFNMRSGGTVGAEGVWTHNFWTRERIEPGTTYHFKAQQAGLPTMEATLPVPPDYDVEVWVKQPWVGGRDSLRITGVNHAPIISMQTYFWDRCGDNTARAYAVDTDSGLVHMIALSRTFQDRALVCDPPEIEKREISIAASTMSWPKTNPARRPDLADAPSNVTNALGFIGAVYSKQARLENCDYVSRTFSPPNPYCKLRYDSATVTINGVVKDTTCSMPVVRGRVELLELDPVAPEVAKRRWIVTNPQGHFEISGLEAGRRYQLSAFRDTTYVMHTATLQFPAGQVLTLDAIRLARRITRCD